MTAMLAAGGILTVAQGHHEFSENENRYLTQFPSLQMSAVLSGETQENITDAFNDQFPRRDFWTSSSTQVKKLLGFQDIGGVYLGEDHYYFEKIMNQDISQTNYFQNLRFVNHLAAAEPEAQVTAMLVPSPGTVLFDLLPSHATLYDADTMYREAEDLLQGVTLLDLRERMLQIRDTVGDLLYYRTDHHWNQYGAYVGYCAYSEMLGRTPDDYDDFGIAFVSDSFYGTLYSKVLDSAAVPDEISAPIILPEVTTTCDGKEMDGIYVDEKAETKDKYAVYFGGNFGEVKMQLRSPQTEEKLLVIKDSFANSMVPFLLQDYEEIRMLDMRYFKGSVSEYLEEYQADEILVLYELSNFAQDENLNRLTK